MTTELEKRLGHEFADRKLFERALTHRSFGARHNERLEFLGDSVLNLAAASLLYRHAERQDEGQLSRLRAALVRAETLAGVARSLDLGRHLRLGEGEAHSGGAQRESILADALEALLGAIYLEAGFDAALAVVQRLFGPLLATLEADVVRKDAKTQLQEVLQGLRLPLPAYTVVDVQGAAHRQHFRVSCAVPALGLTTQGEGDSRRRAEQAAAADMLLRIARGGGKPQRGVTRPVVIDTRQGASAAVAAPAEAPATARAEAPANGVSSASPKASGAPR